MNEELQAIKERAEKAMPAPWHTNSENEILIDNDGRLGKMIRGYDAEFIVHAREDIPTLIAEIERLREALDKITDLEVFDGKSREHYQSLAVQAFCIACKALEGDSNV